MHSHFDSAFEEDRRRLSANVRRHQPRTCVDLAAASGSVPCCAVLCIEVALETLHSITQTDGETHLAIQAPRDHSAFRVALHRRPLVVGMPTVRSVPVPYFPLAQFPRPYRHSVIASSLSSQAPPWARCPLGRHLSSSLPTDPAASSIVDSPTLRQVPSSPGAHAPDASTVHCPFRFSAGYALHAKRHSRPFPPPFLSRPSASFSDPLSTHDKSRDRRVPTVDGHLIRGITNGDDAVLVSQNFICANDGVGAWATREKGHAALWSRLIVHFWALENDKFACRVANPGEASQEPNPVAFLTRAYENTKKATAEPNEWFGTTTVSGALLSYSLRGDPPAPKPVVYVTQLGDSTIMIIRPNASEIIYKTKEQWHWFDCPRQLGTNSPDTPQDNAVMDRVEIEKGDVVLATSDGVGDNLWDHEVMQNVIDSMNRWDRGEVQPPAPGVLSDVNRDDEQKWYSAKMMYVAQELMKAARTIAEDPFAESPYMEKAIDEGLSIEGGKSSPLHRFRYP